MWAAGVVLTEGGTEDDYDYTDYTNYYLIDHVDIYYIGTQGAQCVGTLGRDDFYDTDSCADYINIEARSGVITTYDSSFNAVQTTDSLYNFGEYDYDNSLEEAIQQKTGYYVRSFYGKYAMASGDNGYGIIDRYGNLIVPTNFSSFDTSFDTYENGGYFLSIGNEQTTLCDRRRKRDCFLQLRIRQYRVSSGLWDDRPGEKERRRIYSPVRRRKRIRSGNNL